VRIEAPSRSTAEIGNLATDTETIVGPAGSQVLIGQVVLEQLDLITDCKTSAASPPRCAIGSAAVRNAIRAC